jgi:hypothetical protein
MPESIPLSRKAVIDRISVAIFALAWTLMILRVAPVMLSRTTGPTGLFVLLAGIVAGYLLADLLVAAFPNSGGWLPNDFLLALAASYTVFLFLTNQFHCWAHLPAPPGPVRWLHATGLVLTPRRQALHHRGQHDCAYCVPSGWLNPIPDRLGLFDRLERAFSNASRGSRGRADERSDP